MNVLDLKIGQTARISKISGKERQKYLGHLVKMCENNRLEDLTDGEDWGNLMTFMTINTSADPNFVFEVEENCEQGCEIKPLEANIEHTSTEEYERQRLMFKDFIEMTPLEKIHFLLRVSNDKSLTQYTRNNAESKLNDIIKYI